MGMFDTYRADLACPLDGVALGDLQGQDGPCLLLHFTPGCSEPDEADEGRRLAAMGREAYVAGHPDEPLHRALPGWSARDAAGLRWGMLVGALEERLPPVFGMHAACGDHWVEAVGETDAEGVWVASRVVLVTMAVGDRGASRRVELFRAGRPSTAGLASRRAEHEARRARLPAHGGDAACEGGCRPAAPAVAAMDGFLCRACLEERRARRVVGLEESLVA